MEGNSNNPKLLTIVRICDGLGISLAQFFDDELFGNKNTNTIFIDSSNNYVRFINKKYNFIKLNSKKGIYVTYKFAGTKGVEIGDKVKWCGYGSKDCYTSEIIGYYRDSQVQGITASREYIESLGISYKPDAVYTNKDLSKNETIKNVEVVQNREELKDTINSMLAMMREMIIIIIVFAVLLGVVIIYNMSILSFSEKEYQFTTLKVLGFREQKIKKIFALQNSWICIVSIIIWLPTGYWLTSYLFKACLDGNYDFGVHIDIWTYIVSWLVSKYLARRVDTIDMVSSLKANE